jgi:hypothetical protein
VAHSVVVFNVIMDCGYEMLCSAAISFCNDRIYVWDTGSCYSDYFKLLCIDPYACLVFRMCWAYTDMFFLRHIVRKYSVYLSRKDHTVWHIYCRWKYIYFMYPVIVLVVLLSCRCLRSMFDVLYAIILFVYLTIFIICFVSCSKYANFGTN